MTDNARDLYRSKEEMMHIWGAKIVLTDNLFDWIALAIRAHCRGFYNHACWLYEAGVVVSQDWHLEKRSLGQYLKGKNRVKIWAIKGLTMADAAAIQTRLNSDVKKRGRYDWLGVIGQLVSCRWINFSGRNYCSEHVVSVLKFVRPNAAKALGEHPSPRDIDKYFSAHPEGFEVAGIFDPYMDGFVTRLFSVGSSGFVCLGVETYKKGESEKAGPPCQL